MAKKELGHVTSYRVCGGAGMIDMERLDVMTVAPGVERSIQAKGEGRTLMLRIRDTTNLQ